VMVLLWIFSDYLSRAYDEFVLPLLGFFFLPTTTLTYAVAETRLAACGMGVGLVIFGALLDLGIWGGGRGVFKKD
jgi:hypothetical protein